MQSHDLQRVARQVKDTERRLASQVDAVAALTLLQRDLFARINPAIVEAYLDRLDAAGIASVQKTAAGEGFRRISRPGRPSQRAWAEAAARSSPQAAKPYVRRRRSTSADSSRSDPGEPAFTDLIDVADHELAEDVFQSGAVEDPTSLTAYDLYAFEAEMTESDGKRSSVWATLVKVDDGGNARPVRWETLANLVPGQVHGTAASSRSPAGRRGRGRRGRRRRRSTEHRKVRGDWFAQARKDLTNLPLALTDAIDDRDERIALRKTLQQQTARRLEQLEQLAQVAAHRAEADRTPPRAARGHTRARRRRPVRVGGDDATFRSSSKATDGTSTTSTPRAAATTSRHAATLRSAKSRSRASLATHRSDGIRMTGNEVLIATQHRTSYWLYVVDQCADGTGRLFGAYEDPATLFSTDMVGDAIFRVPGVNPQERTWEHAVTRMIERWFPCAEVSANSDRAGGAGNSENATCSRGSRRGRLAQAKAAVICSPAAVARRASRSSSGFRSLVRDAMTGRYAAGTRCQRRS